MSRFLHTMLRVGDLQRSVDFYTKGFGMKELRRRDVPDGKYTLAFVGYGDEDSNSVIELTYNYGVKEYDQGTAFDATQKCRQRAGRGRGNRGGHSRHWSLQRSAGMIAAAHRCPAGLAIPDAFCCRLCTASRRNRAIPR